MSIELDSGTEPNLAGQTGLVTGAGRGIGRACAIALARSGMSVALLARSVEQITDTAASIEAAGGKALAIPADVTDRNAVVAAVRLAEQHLGPIQLLVNNAGSGGPIGPTWETQADEWWWTIEVNLKGAFLCSHAVMPGMVLRGSGRIVNIASGAGTRSIPYMSAYVTSKAAMIRLGELLADETRPHGVQVFGVQPGTVRTDMVETLLHTPEGAKWVPWLRKILDEGRDVSASVPAALVLFLASGQADRLSGKFLNVGWDIQDMLARTDEIAARDLYTLRLRTLD